MKPELLAAAQRIAAEPILKRVYRAGDVPLQFRDTRASALTNNRREWFTLSMADMFMAMVLAKRLPLVAQAAFETNDARLQDYALAQLAELQQWQPLNRPGWSLLWPGPEVPPDFNDGNWLGTGLGVHAIASTLEALGGRVPPSLRSGLHQLLVKEIAGVRDDFATRRVWFWNTPVSNQFVLPNCAVLLACAELKKAAGDADYDFAAQNILRSLDAQGTDGAFHEGASYSAFTTTEILAAVRRAGQLGDDRFARHSHLVNFGKWLLHQVQPGMGPLQPRIVNAFDANDNSLEARYEPNPLATSPLNNEGTVTGIRILDACMLHAMTTRDAQVLWFLEHVPAKLPLTAIAAAYDAWRSRENPPQEAPPTFGSYTSSPLVVWRDTWEHNGTGVWIRGGSSRDSHDHADRGHVNVIFKGRDVLLEAGSSDYATPDYSRIFAGGIGHNVLQIGATEVEAAQRDGLAKRGSNAPIQVIRLDTGGGEIVVNAGAAYNPALLAAWRRRVRWSKDEVTIDDAVQLAPTRLETILLRFHLGHEIVPQIRSTNEDHCVQAQWKQGRMEFCANAPVTLTAGTHLHGISYTRTANHTVLLVSSQGKVTSLNLTTTLSARDF